MDNDFKEFLKVVLIGTFLGALCVFGIYASFNSTVPDDVQCIGPGQCLPRIP